MPPVAGAPCDRRLSRACVIEKNLAWSELGQQGCLICGAVPAQGLQRKFGASAAEKVQARPFVGDVGRPSLNFEIAARGGRAVARWVPRNAQGAPTTVRPIALLRGLEMSGSEFERENILAMRCRRPRIRNRPRPRARARLAPARRGSLRSRAGEGFLRRRLHRQHQGQEVASDRLRRAQHSLQPRASRRGRRRSARRRRRRHPGADSARLLRAQGGRDRLPAAEARRLRGRRAVHAEGHGVAQGHQEHHRRPDQGRRTDAARLARRADRQFLARPDRQADRARPHAGVHRPQRRGERPTTNSSDGSTSCASRFRRRSISAATAGWPAITRCRCRAAPWSTRACSSPTSSPSIIPT